MTNACPIPTPAEREYGAILASTQDELIRKVGTALQEAVERMRSEVETAGLAMSPATHEHYAAIVHQHMYCVLCGADPKTFAGGRAKTAIAVIRNSQRIAKHYWGAEIEPHP